MVLWLILCGLGCRSSPEAIVLRAESPQRLVVPVEAQGADGRWRTLSMLVDTGASMSALTPQGLKALGMETSTAEEDGEVWVRLPTANGVVRERVLWMPPLRLGGGVVEGATAVGCSRCPSGMDGLLGLNVLARYTVTVDVAAGQVTLQAKESEEEQVWRDMVPWLRRRVRRVTLAEGGAGVRVSVQNRSDRPMSEVRLTVACLSGDPLVFSGLAAGAQQVAEVAVPGGGPCKARQTEVVAGRWAP